MFMILNPPCAIAFVVHFFTEGDPPIDLGVHVPKYLLGL